jgi:hypothetical protein
MGTALRPKLDTCGWRLKIHVNFSSSSSPFFSALRRLAPQVEQFGLAKQFQNPKLGITAFVPNNDAYDRISKAINNNPAILDNSAIITQALAYHILNKPLTTEDMPRGVKSYLTALPNQPVAVQFNDKANLFKVGAYNVVERNIQAGRSVIHVIDGFLVAPSLMPTLVKALRESKAAAAEAAPAAAAAPAVAAAVKKP